MGLPRTLSNNLREYLYNKDQPELFMLGFATGVSAVNSNVQQAIIDVKKREISIRKPYQSVSQWRCRSLARPVISSPDELTHVKARMYVGIEVIDDDEIARFRDVTVPQYFLLKLEKLNIEREELDREEIVLRLKISLFRNRVLASRTFPSILKDVIFERDNYICQVCLRGREVLKKTAPHGRPWPS